MFEIVFREREVREIWRKNRQKLIKVQYYFEYILVELIIK